MDKPSKKVYDKEKNPIDRSKLGKLEGSSGSSSTVSGDSFYKPASSGSTSTNAEGNVDLKNQEASGGFYTSNTSSTGEDKSNVFSRVKNIKITKRRAAAGGGILGIVIGAFAFFNIAQGPFQFIHFAQLLQQFHFAGQEDMGDDRVSRLYRYARSGGDYRQTRVGLLGSKMAPKIEAKFAKAGIKVNYEGPAQIARSFEIDRDNPKWSGMSEQDLQDYARRNNLNMTIENGRARIAIPTSIFARTGPVIKWALKESGTYKVVTPIQSRTFGKWAGITWHPLRRADARVNETIGDYYKKIRDAYDKKVAKGATAVQARSNVGEDQEGDEEGNREKQNGRDAAGEAERIGQEAADVSKQTTGRQAALNTLRDGLNSRITRGGFLATAAICILYEMNKAFEALKLANLILPLMRLSGHAVSMGNQVMNGTDAEIEQLGAYNDQFHDPEAGSWQNSRTMQAEQGRPQSGPEVNSVLSAIPEDSPFAFLDGISGIGALCSTVGQVIVGVVTVILTIFTGGGFGALSFAIGTIGSMAGQVAAMHLFAALFANAAVDTYVRGPAFADYANYGARLSANATGLSRGGVVLTPQESAAIQLAVDAEYDREFSNKSIASRIFDPNDARSVVAQILDRADPEVSGTVARVSNIFTNFGGFFSSLSSTIFSPVKAQSAGYDYGFPEYGFSISDLENPLVENPYSNAAQAAQILDNNPDYAERVKKCFGINVTKDGEGVWSAVASLNPNDMPNPYNATDDDVYANQRCNERTDDWLQVRFFIFDSVLIDAANCYEEDDEQSCNNIGFTPPPPPAGGPVDCNAESGIDQSPGDPYATPYGDQIVAAAQGLTCPEYPKPGGAVPSDPGLQYMAYDGCSDGCGIQGERDGRRYIRVKYRNPPLAGNTIEVFVDP